MNQPNIKLYQCAIGGLIKTKHIEFWALNGTEIFTNCSTGGIVAGFYTRTGAWTDAIGAYCLPYKLNAVTYNVNGGSGTAPATQTQTAPAQNLTVSSSYTGTRTGFGDSVTSWAGRNKVVSSEGW